MRARLRECLWCGELFESKKGRRQCRACWARAIRRRKEEQKALVEDWMRRMEPYLGGREMPTEQQTARWLKRLWGRAALNDQPLGWLSTAGSDEGYSTYFHDLGAELDWRVKELQNHPWFEERPHWAVGIPGSEHMLDVPPMEEGEPACGNKRGSLAGYWRHKRLKTMACPECSAAKAEQSRKEREALAASYEG